MRALVTGPTGLIGSYLCEALVGEGHAVRGLVRDPEARLTASELEVVPGDLTDAESLRRAVEGVDVVFHTAARMSDWGPWEAFLAVNVEGTRSLCEAALEAGVERFVHTSSTGVLGIDAVRGGHEEMPYDGVGHYEESKVESEKIARRFGTERGLPVTVVRPCWTLGPRARRHIPLLVDYLERGLLMVIGSGRNPLSFVDPRDVAQGMMLAATHPAGAGEIYHLTNGETDRTQGDLYRILAEELGVRPPWLHAPYRVALGFGAVAERWAEWRGWDDAPFATPIRVKFLGLERSLLCDKAQRELGYRPRYSLRQSLRDAVAWYRDPQAPVRPTVGRS